jgi:hypothetical protein
MVVRFSYLVKYHVAGHEITATIIVVKIDPSASSVIHNVVGDVVVAGDTTVNAEEM